MNLFFITIPQNFYNILTSNLNDSVVFSRYLHHFPSLSGKGFPDVLTYCKLISVSGMACIDAQLWTWIINVFFYSSIFLSLTCSLPNCYSAYSWYCRHMVSSSKFMTMPFWIPIIFCLSFISEWQRNAPDGRTARWQLCWQSLLKWTLNTSWTRAASGRLSYSTRYLRSYRTGYPPVSKREWLHPLTCR